MNRKKLASVFAVAVLSSMLSQKATAQAITVKAPFAFSAGSQEFPAGTYQFIRLSDWALSIRNVNSGSPRFFPLHPAAAQSPESAAGASFRLHGDGSKSLQTVYVPGAEHSLELIGQAKAKRETKSALAFIAASAK